MAYRRPARSLWAFTILAPEVAPKLVEHLYGQQQWLMDLPYHWLTALLAAFFLGGMVEDLLNPSSDLRHNWREWRKIFDAIAFYPAHRTDPERIDIMCILKFKKTLPNARLVVRVRHGKDASHVVRQESIYADKDSQQTFRIGSLAIPRAGDAFTCHSVWGEVIGGQNLLAGQIPISDFKGIVEISVDHQKYSVYVDIGDHTREESKRIHLLTEGGMPVLHD